MAEEAKDEKKPNSRKWAITVWAFIIGTLIVVFEGVCSLMGKACPAWFGRVATLLFSTGIAYIGGNVWQKKIFADKEDK